MKIHYNVNPVALESETTTFWKLRKGWCYITFSCHTQKRSERKEKSPDTHSSRKNSTRLDSATLPLSERVRCLCFWRQYQQIVIMGAGGSLTCNDYLNDPSPGERWKIVVSISGCHRRPGTLEKVNVIQLANLFSGDSLKAFQSLWEDFIRLAVARERRERVCAKKAACKAQTNHQHKLEFLGNHSHRN